MEEKFFNSDKLNILEVIKESISLCKDNYKLLLKASLFIFLINIFNTSLSYARTISGKSAAFIIISLVILVVSLPIMYLGAKLSITLWICISKRYSNKSISIKEAFKMSAESIWSYIGTNILFSLIFLPFIIIGLLLYFFVNVTIAKWLFISILVISSLYVSTIFGFAPVAAVLEAGRTNYFKLSKRLVEGNLWRIVLLDLIIFIMDIPGLLMSNLNPWFKGLTYYNQFAINIGYNFIKMFISPFTVTVSIVLYLTLRKKIIYKQ